MLIRKSLRYWLASLLIPFLGFTCSPASGASGADVVFVVDESGSMWGMAEYKGVPNDRSNYRYAGIEQALYLVAAAARGTPNVYRVSVIEFGSHAIETVAPTELRYDPAAPDAMDLKVRSLFAKLNKLSAIGSAPGDFNTNTPEALAMARDELARMPPDPSGTRTRSVVLITDGRPYVSRNVSTQSLFDATDRAAEDIRRLGANFYVLGINDIGNADAGYWQRGDGVHWKQIVGTPENAQLVQPVGEELPPRIASIMGQALHMEAQTGTPFRLGPYESLLAVTVTVERATQALPLLVLPDGRTVSAHPPGPGTAQGGARALSYDLANPPVGNYEIRFGRDPLGYLITGQVAHSAFPSRLSLMSPAKIVAGRAAPIELRLVGATDADFQSFNPSWPVSNAVARVAGGGPGFALSLTAPGKFVGHWTPPRAGKFTFLVSASYSAPDGSSHLLFGRDGAPITIEASARPPFDLVPDQTANDALKISPFGKQAVTLSFTLVDGVTGKPAPTAALVAHSPALLHMLDTSGNPEPGARPIAMRAQGNQLMADVPVSIDWWNTRDWWFWSPPHRLAVEVEADPGALPDGVFGGIMLPRDSGLTHVRSLHPENTAAGFNASGAGWLSMVAVMAGLLILVPSLLGLGLLALRLIAIRVEDSRRNRAVQLVIFPSNANPTIGVGLRKFDVTGQRRLNLDRQIQLRVDAATELLEKLRVRRLAGTERQAFAEMTYRLRGAQKENRVNLKTGEGAAVLLPGLGDKWSATLILEPMRRRQPNR